MSTDLDKDREPASHYCGSRGQSKSDLDVPYVGTMETVKMIKNRSILSVKNYVLPTEFILMNLHVSVIYNTHVHELAYQLDNFKIIFELQD